MENLITKHITYNSLRTFLNEDEEAIQAFIKSINSPEIRDRVIDEAKEFYATQFNVNKEDIWYGDISCRYPECKNPFPFSHVIGSIDLGQTSVNMSKLVYCKGISSTNVQVYPNLEIIDGVGNFNGTPHRKSYISALPKLKVAPYLYCANSMIRELNLESSIKVNLTNSSIRKISLKVVEEDFSVSFSQIEDISSLERVGNLNCRGTNIKHINPNLKITGNLHAENSNHFENRISSEQIGDWHIDN